MMKLKLAINLVPARALQRPLANKFYPSKINMPCINRDNLYTPAQRVCMSLCIMLITLACNTTRAADLEPGSTQQLAPPAYEAEQKKISPRAQDLQELTLEKKRVLNRDLLEAAISGLDPLPLLQQGADINTKDGAGGTAILFATDTIHRKKEKNGQEETDLFIEKYIQVLIRAGADVNNKNNEGLTPIMCAAYHGYHRTVKVLLAAGAQANVYNPKGQTPLMLTCSPHVAHALIQAKADVNSCNLDHENTLMLAVRKNNKDVLNVLLQSPNLNLFNTNKAGKNVRDIIRDAHYFPNSLFARLDRYEANRREHQDQLIAARLAAAKLEGNGKPKTHPSSTLFGHNEI